MKTLHSFLGTNTPDGFVSLFRQAYTEDWQVWLLKGGPGCGKSTLMKKLAQRPGGFAEQVHCPSDPASLDAVLLPQKRAMVMDATAPHALEPDFPGCTEHLVNLDSGLDASRLRLRKKEVLQLFEENRACHKQAAFWLAAAAKVRLAQTEEARLWLDERAVEQFVQRVLRQVPTAERPGGETRRILRAVTPQGVVCWPNLTENTHGCRLRDGGGAAAQLFTARLRDELLRRGQYLYTGMDCLFPRQPEALFLPEQEWLCLPDTYPAAEKLPLLELKNCYRPFAGKPAEEHAEETALLAAAEGWQRRALRLHDELEALYREAMDFSAADEAADTIGREIAALPDVPSPFGRPGQKE